MVKFLLGLGTGLVFLKKISGLSFLVFANDLALVLGWGILLLFILILLVGFLGGWFLARKRKLFLLKIKKRDRVLFIVPHPDDESLAGGGLLNYLWEGKIPLRVIFLTAGDGNPSLFWQDKKVKFSFEEFVKLGRKRREEAIEAAKELGGKEKDLIFLSYPDSCLAEMEANPKKLIASSHTGLTCSPYQFSFKRNREYRGENLINDLVEIIKKFKPTVIFTSHSSDTNQDHRASFFFVEKAIEKAGWQGKTYRYLIHYNWFFSCLYPPKRKPGERKKIIYPPFLGKSGRWFSFWLNPRNLAKKKIAIYAHKSQLAIPNLRWFFSSFLAQNEIFEQWDGD